MAAILGLDAAFPYQSPGPLASIIPIIVMTSDIHGRAKEFFDISSQLGATFALEKPISKEKLETALNEAMLHISEQ